MASALPNDTQALELACFDDFHFQRNRQAVTRQINIVQLDQILLCGQQQVALTGKPMQY